MDSGRTVFLGGECVLIQELRLGLNQIDFSRDGAGGGVGDRHLEREDDRAFLFRVRVYDS